MPFADPTAYSKGQINRAGESARSGEAGPEALEIINNWRASHAYILNTFQATLRNRTRGTGIAVAQRLKRLRTLVNKLERLPKMQLSRMDDVAGCRLIFKNIRAMTQFREAIHTARFEHKVRNEIEKYDYTLSPKADGYRGIHDIYEYNVKSQTGKAYNGLLLELQYRTIYQHAWATTVEIVGMITENQPKFHAGDERHVEFFRLASEIIARTYERQTSCYPDVSNPELVSRFRDLDREIHILQLLGGLSVSTEQLGGKKNVILSMSGSGQLSFFTYAKGTDALRKYFELEKLHGGADVVLVKADTGADIRLSYKNYFSDPSDFLTYVNHGCAQLLRPAARLRKQN